MGDKEMFYEDEQKKDILEETNTDDISNVEPKSSTTLYEALNFDDLEEIKFEDLSLESSTEADTESNIAASTESNTESNIEASTEANTESNIEAGTEANIEANTESNIEVVEEPKEDETEKEEMKKLKEENDKLKEELTKLKEDSTKPNSECENLKDRLLRITAEYDNFRKRTSKEKEGIYTDACVDVLKNILPVLDNLERALEVDGSIEDLKKGIEMTQRQFKDALEKLQIEEIPTDIEFDPNLHSAVMHVVDETYGTNSIVDVFQKGYKRNSKVIRYSMVKVAN